MSGRSGRRARGSSVIAALCAVGVLAASPARALEGSVQEPGGKPIANAVVYLVPTAGRAPIAGAKTAIMDQYDKEFVPYVLPVQAGTAVNFPNHDNLKHQVYSFSPAKRFDLPLYSGVPAKPVVFDKVGPVVLGCNIHDWMLGHIYVVDTPYFTLSGEDGRWKLAQVPEGEYQLLVWHPRMTSTPEEHKRRVTITSDAAAKAEPFSLKLGREYRRPRRQQYENLN